MITMEMTAKAQLARLKTSQDTNPLFELSELGELFSLGESVVYVTILGDVSSGTAQVNRSLVEYFFGKSASQLEPG